MSSSTNNKHIEVADKISALDARFVRHERYERLAHIAQGLLQKRLADLRAGRQSEATSIALTAAAGSGKTKAMEKLISDLQESIGQSDFPEGKIVSLNVPSPASLKAVGQTILSAVDYDLKPNREAWYIWDLVRYHLRENRVLFLHLDEAQDLKSRSTVNEISNVVNTLKSISQDPEWPVGLLLSGTEGLQQIVNFDPQLVRRVKGLRFAPLCFGGDAIDILDLVESYAARAGLRFDRGDQNMQLGERVIHASAYQFGLCITLTIYAIEDALLADDTVLTWQHFERGYQEWKDCDDAFNPFLVPDFTRLDPLRLFDGEDLS